MASWGLDAILGGPEEKVCCMCTWGFIVALSAMATVFRMLWEKGDAAAEVVSGEWDPSWRFLPVVHLLY